MQTFIFETSAGLGHPLRWSIELADVRAAQIQAVQTIGEMLAQDGEAFWSHEAVSMTVSDENGLVLFRLDLAAVIAPALLKP